jgi:dihydroneopterin aldolase
MNDSIRINGIKGFGFHGVLAAETKNGQEFFVDVELILDLENASRSDELNETVDYGLICDLVLQKITSGPYKLIEKLAGIIADEILATQKLVDVALVTVHKPSAPVNVTTSDINVMVIRTR